MPTLTIAGRKVGPGQPCWIVAELGANAARDYATAEALVRAAKEAGADSVKTQCFEWDTMTLQDDSPPFQLTWAGKETSLWQLYAETAMPLGWHKPLKDLAESLGMVYFASVFSPADADFMSWLDVPAYKIASFEITDLPLIRAVAKKGKPILLSTGMAELMDVLEAINAADEGMRDRIRLPENRGLAAPAPVVVLKCTSAYPAPASEANLRTIQDPRLRAHTAAGWRNEYTPYLHGLSDHTRSNAVVSAAVTLGACIVERHLTLDRSAGGPDAAFSDEPVEFAAMVRAIREAEAALGTVHYGPTESELPMLRYRRSLWVVKDLAEWEVLTTENVRSLRPIGGLEPRHLPDVLGKRAKRALVRGTALGWEDLV